MYDRPPGGGEITCQLFDYGDEVHLALTDATGVFLAKLKALSILPPDCVEVTVKPMEGSGLNSVVDTVLVGWSLDEGSAPVSRINLVLPS